MSFKSKVKRCSRRYIFAEDGNMSMMFGLFATVLLGGVGLAVDTNNRNTIEGDVQASLDAAVIAIATTHKDSARGHSTINVKGTEFFNSNFTSTSEGINVNSVNFNFDTQNNQILGTAQVTIDTSFMSLFGFNTVTSNVQSAAIVNGKSNFPTDISMMLDVSGSMDGEKLDGLKDAVTGFLDKAIGQNNVSTTTRVAFAPFSSSVNAGSYAASLIGGSTSTNCVGDRIGVSAFTDAKPTGSMFDVDGTYAISNDENGDVYREGYFSGYGPVTGLDEIPSSTICSSAELQPLTGNYNSLVNTLNSYSAEGITAGHLGIAFASYLIAEEWRDFWPALNAPGLDNATQKIAILMTDGQFNTYYNQDSGLPNEQSRQLCANMKADGVTIFSVSFDTEGESEDVLKECASETDYFYNVDTSSELITAFSNIADSLGEGNARLIR